MKKIIAASILMSVLIACKSEKKEKEEIVIGTKEVKQDPVSLGKKLFNGKGKCIACHQINKKTVGPSVKEIVAVYKEKKGDLLGFLKEEQPPIVAPESFAVMKTNYAILKTFKDKELEALIAYMKKIGQE